MGFISDKSRKDKQALQEEREANRLREEAAGIDDFCCPANINRIVAKIKEAVEAEFVGSGNRGVMEVSINLDLHPAVTGNTECEQVLLDALLMYEPSTNKVSLVEYAPHGGSNRPTGIQVRFNPPLT